MWDGTLDASGSRRAVFRNLGLDVIGALGVGATGALVMALLPAIARRAGVEPLGLAALVATPFIANLLSAFAGRVGPRSPAQLAALRAVGAGCLLLLLVVPLPPGMLVIALAYMLTLSFSNPFQLRLWGAMYPARFVGRALGVLGMSRAAAGALAALIGGLAADRLGVPVVIAATGCFGMVTAFAYAGLRAGSSGRPPRFSARESIRALRERPTLSRVALAQGFFGGALIGAVPLYALVHVDRLHLSLAAVGAVGIAMSITTTLSFPIWGTLVDRRGALATLRLGSLLGIVALAGYAVSPTLLVLIPVAVALGATNAAVDVGLSSFISAETPMEARAAAQAGWNAITGARGIGAAFLGSGLVSLGLVDVTGALLLCAVSAAVGAFLFFSVRPASAVVPTRAEVASPAVELAPT
jgi:hypothetical protein